MKNFMELVELVVSHNADMRGTTSTAASPGLMNLIGAFDDSDEEAARKAVVQIANEIWGESDDFFATLLAMQQSDDEEDKDLYNLLTAVVGMSLC